MISKDSNSQYLDPSNVLEDHKEDMYRNVLHIQRPITSARSYTKSARRDVRPIDKALSLDPEEQEKILDILTDLVSKKSFSLEDWEDREEEIEKTLENFDIFKKLENQFEQFDKKQQERIIEHSFKRILQEASKLEEAVRMEMVEDESDKNQRGLLILGEAFDTMKNLASRCLNRGEYKSKYSIALIVLVLKLEALRRDKVDFEELEETIYNLGREVKHERPPVDDDIFEVVETA